MADRAISVVMESRYKSGLSEKLYKDEQTLRRFGERLKRNPLVIPVRLDLKGAMTQAAALRKAILGEFARMPTSILGADGRPATAPASGGREMNKRAGVLSATTTQTWDPKGGPDKTGGWKEQIAQLEQLGKGMSEINKFKDGELKPFQTITKDISNVQDLRDALRGMNSEQGKTFAAARGRGDKKGQIEALKNQDAALTNVMTEAATAGLKNSPLYDRAEDRISRIQEKIAGLEGGMSSASEKKAYKDNTRLGDNAIKDEYRKAQEKLKQAEIDEAAANAIPQRVAREAALNKVYDDRKRILQESRDKFREMGIEQTKAGRGDLSDRAMRAGLVQNNQVNQVDVERARMESKRVLETQKEIEKSKRLADAAAAKSGNRNFGRALRLDDNTTKLQLAQNKADEAASKSLPTRAAQEAELNRVLSERSRIIQEQQTRLGNLQQTQTKAGNLDNAAKAEAASLKAGQNAAGVGVSQVKADSDAQIAAANKAAADQKAAAAKARSDRESGFAQEMQDIKRRSAAKIAGINVAEQQERAAAKIAAERNAASAKAHAARVGEYNNLSNEYKGVDTRARAAGHAPTANGARGKSLDALTAGDRDTQKFAASTTKSGHALNFHTSSLLKNAATYTRWMIPVQAVLAATSAISAGVQGAIKVDRQFATLKAVFRGTAEEAQKLKNETLDLAAAQGRSTDEAMDSSIRWSRLGLTRIEVLEATRVSLMAANVAEISTAEAAEKLSGIYAAYGLNVSDLAGGLNRLNSISNNYNVTVDDLFEGISRVAGVAKQSGLALRDLEGMMGSVVGAGGGSGAEVGNAVKFVISRLGDTKVGDQLKKAFDIDLTGPNGDLKDMSQIMAEMAALYPTLNKAQQQSFLQMAAGARQASRFALAMTEYRQGQILAAKASFDHAASMRENENILQSLQSRIESLSASWTSLFTAMGDAGAMDRAVSFVRYLQQIAMGVEGRIDDATEKTKGFTIKNPMYAESVEKLGGGENKWFGTRTDFDRSEVEEALKKLEKGRVEGRNPLVEINRKLVGVARADKMGIKESYYVDGLTLTRNEIDKAIQHFKTLLDKGGDSVISDEMTKITSGINKLRDEVEGFPTTAGIFDSLGEGFAAGTVDRESLIKDFQQVSYLLTQLPDGQNIYNDSLKTFNDLLASGDKGKMRDFLKGLGAKNSDQGKAATEKLRSEVAAQQSELGQKLAGLQGKKAALEAAPVTGGADALKEKQEAIKAINSEIKATTATIEGINTVAKNIDDVLKSAFNPGQVSNINKYFEDLKAQAQAVGEAFKDFAPDAANDPVDRIFQRRRRAAGLALDWSRETLAATEAGDGALRAGVIYEAVVAIATFEQAGTDFGADAIKNSKGDSNTYSDGQLAGKEAEIKAGEILLEQQQRIGAQQDAAVERAKTEVGLREEELAVILRKLEYEEKIAAIQRGSDAGSEFADNSSQAWRFGETESDKNLNQAQAAMERAEKYISEAKSGAIGSTPEEKANIRGRVVQDEATARAALKSVDRRQYEIDAARKQAAIDTAKAMEDQTAEASKQTAEASKQTAEASKLLMMASREDQLRAAAIARTIRDKGAIGANEFSALSQESRQAITTYLPNAPGAANNAKISEDKSLRDLDAEQGRISSTIGDLRGTLDKLATKISEVTGKGGALDIVPAPPPASVKDVANTPRDKSPLVNLQFGGVSINVKLGEEVERLMTGYVDRVLATGLEAMERRLNRPPAPNAQGVVEG